MIERAKDESRERNGIKVYSGDTVGNFLLAATETSFSTVEYDKSKIPEPAYRQIFTDASGVSHPFYRALRKAFELNDVPLIMESYISRFAPYAERTEAGTYGRIIVPEGIPLVVSSVWIPEDDNWRKPGFHLGDQELVGFVQKNALLYLRSLKEE